MPALSQLVDPSIYSNVKAPESMSLGDMVNLNRSSMAMQKEKALLQPSIEAGQAASRQAVTQADTAQLENTLKHATVATQNIQQLLTKPDITSKDVVEMVKKTADTHGGNPQSVQQALMGLPENGSPTQIRAWLAQNLTKTLSTQAQLEKLYPGGVLPGQLPTSYQPEISKEPKPANVEPYSQPEKFSYPTPVAGQARAQLPSEENDRAFGEKVRTELTNTQRNYGSVRQNYDKLIDQANMLSENTFFSGAAGTAERALKAKIGTPEYQQLSKDLANAQISQIKAEGGSLDTVSGQSLLAHANGSVVYDPKVLVDIARRNAANIENKNMQATGMRNFTDKYGDANMKHFISMWNKNANDNSVFEMKYIFDKNGGGAAGTKAIQEYIKSSGLSAEKRKELATKYLNLQKLETTGTL